jgi:hypothetical protein
MLRTGRQIFLLVIVDHFTSCVEPFPLLTVTAESFIKVLLEWIVPSFGLVENIDSVSESHFTLKVLKGIMESSDINWDFHIP